VFLSNFPEAVSSAGTMKAAGLSIKRIMTLWLFTFFATGLGALIGAAIMPVDQSEGFELFVKGMEGFAAGAMLTMIAQTMLPEAFHQVERKSEKRREEKRREEKRDTEDREGGQTREGAPTLPCCM
jgi:zinc transporter ZupT